ncbi:MAG: hypothetical protein NVV62_18025 [Terricaulis sp.]|nr:hypothetical protein [Terricaulis sp.]
MWVAFKSRRLAAEARSHRRVDVASAIKYAQNNHYVVVGHAKGDRERSPPAHDAQAGKQIIPSHAAMGQGAEAFAMLNHTPDELLGDERASFGDVCADVSQIVLRAAIKNNARHQLRFPEKIAAYFVRRQRTRGVRVKSMSARDNRFAKPPVQRGIARSFKRVERVRHRVLRLGVAIFGHEFAQLVGGWRRSG